MDRRRTRNSNFSVVSHEAAHFVHPSPHDDLYFFRSDNGLVKIGRSANVRQRLNHIRCSSPVGVMLWAVIEGRGHEETLWHRCFEDHRRSGEWFKWCHPISRAIRLAQNGRDWWKPNINAPDTVEDENTRKWLDYLKQETAKRAA
jgi:hypothetical protein